MTTIAIAGTIGRDPELRYGASGGAICKFSLADRYKPKDRDEETSWWEVVCFGDMATNVAESFGKGDRVVVIGRPAIRKYEKKDGGTGISTELVADEVGASVRWATVQVSRTERNQTPQRGTKRRPADDDVDIEF